MKKFSDRFWAFVGSLFLGGFIIANVVIVIGLSISMFKTGFDAIHSVSKTVVGIFSNQKEEKTQVSVNQKETMADLIKLATERKETMAEIICAGFELQLRKLKEESPEKVRDFSSMTCESVDSNFAIMNYKLSAKLSEIEIRKIKLVFEKYLEKDPTFKQICRLYTKSNEQYDFKKLSFKFNYFTYNDEFIYSTVIDSNRCHNDQYATKQGQDLEM